MKYFIYIVFIIVTAASCSPKPQKDPVSCFQGKLVKRGICGQRVIQLLSPPAELVITARNWTDSLSGKKYVNVFTVENQCDFPASINEGDVFNFSITNHPSSNCITCYAYTAVPKEKNKIAMGCTQ